jgi:hypothetical protein
MIQGFRALRELLREPLREEGSVKTDNSILLVYPPGEELDFREQLLDSFVPQLQAMGHSYRLLDLSRFLFNAYDQATISDLCEDEFDDFHWMLQGLSSRVEQTLPMAIAELAAEIPGGTVIAYSSVSLYPLIRFGELLRDLRDLHCRIAIAFPGEDRGGKLFFMKQADGGNYLAVKLLMKGGEQ